ncbi:hypothetical protein F4694_001532 [Bacillus niacini]|uniref:Uncharacterized protein n=1 Tax=Neobacillus niacini TaxID=86668 RepID=A0A852T7Z0_9BACI|nr:hypothetical protein [Neobacillus niacini]
MLSHFLRAWADSRKEIQSPAGGRVRGDPTGAVARQAPRTARGKRSASGQAETACPCEDYSKEHSLVERESTEQFKAAY